MARAVAPLPVKNAAVEADKRFALPWERWLKTVSDFAEDAGRVVTVGSMSYCLVGALAHVEYDGAGGVTLELPYVPVGKLWIDVCVDNVWAKVAATAKPNGRYQVILPAGTSVQFNSNFATSLNRGTP